MKRALVMLGLLAAATAAAVPAQTVSLGVQGAFGDYREVSSNLRFRGTGVGTTLWLRVSRLSAEGSFSQVNFDPRDASSGLTGFKATQLDARLGVDVAAGFSAEVGVMKRTIDPDLTAQEVGAGRIGVRYSKLIGPGASVALRGNYLVGAKFTGEGSAGLAFELGLFVYVGPQSGRYRFTMDYGFQRIDRKVADVSVPIQQSLVKLGVAVGF
jgi:hypothetical protein